MSLIGGFRTLDGFVIAADTEIIHGSVNYQNSKLEKYFSEKFGYELVIGGAGSVTYFTMTAQHIRDAVAALPSSPTVTMIRAEIEKTVFDIHKRLISEFWPIDSDSRPSFDLIVGASVKRDSGGYDSLLVRTEDVAVAEIRSHDFIGSGSMLAEHVAEKVLLSDGSFGALTTARTMHLAAQIYREIKGKGEAVGGNTEIYGRRIARDAEPFFLLPAKADKDSPLNDYRFMWGMEDQLLSAVRIALDRNGREESIDSRIEEIRKRLKAIRSEAMAERSASTDSMHYVEFGSEYGNPFKDS